MLEEAGCLAHALGIERRPGGRWHGRDQELAVRAQRGRVVVRSGQLGVHEAQRVLAVRQARHRLEHLDEPEAPGGAAVQGRGERLAERDLEDAAQQPGDDRRGRQLHARVLGQQADGRRRLGVHLDRGAEHDEPVGVRVQAELVAEPDAGRVAGLLVRAQSLQQRGARVRLRGPALVGRGDVVGGHGDEALGAQQRRVAHELGADHEPSSTRT